MCTDPNHLPSVSAGADGPPAYPNPRPLTGAA